MMKYIINILKGKRLNALMRESESSFKSFRRNVERVNRTNKKITEVIGEKSQKKLQLDNEIETLAGQRAANRRLAEKLQDFIS